MANARLKEIEDYVNVTIAEYVKPINNIESIRCARQVDHIYIELVHEDSYTRYFDISSMDLSSVGIIIGHIIANEKISFEIRDRAIKREVRKIFNK